MIVVTYRKIFYWIAAVAVGASVAAVAFFGLNIGVDFTGGALVEIRYIETAPEQVQIESTLENIGVAGYSLRTAGDNGYILRTGVLGDGVREALPEALAMNGEHPVSIERFTEVGPTIGQELRNKAFIALSLAIIAIILYIAFTFRKVSKPVSSWVYGLLAIGALLHDIIVPVGLFAVLGHVFGAQVDVLFIMALLAILGYSVNDTIVVFDRVRENLNTNLERGKKEEFALTVGRSLNQTFVRSLNTSVTTLLALIALFFFGPIATQDFALTLIMGVVAGAFSSLALATPLLVTIERWQSRRK